MAKPYSRTLTDAEHAIINTQFLNLEQAIRAQLNTYLEKLATSIMGMKPGPIAGRASIPPSPMADAPGYPTAVQYLSFTVGFIGTVKEDPDGGKGYVIQGSIVYGSISVMSFISAKNWDEESPRTEIHVNLQMRLFSELYYADNPFSQLMTGDHTTVIKNDPFLTMK